jgi:hypothetical protein
LKPARANSSKDLIMKNPITKNWAGGVAQGKGPEFKPQYHKNKTKQKKTSVTLNGCIICTYQDLLTHSSVMDFQIF